MKKYVSTIFWRSKHVVVVAPEQSNAATTQNSQRLTRSSTATNDPDTEPIAEPASVTEGKLNRFLTASSQRIYWTLIDFERFSPSIANEIIFFFYHSSSSSTATNYSKSGHRNIYTVLGRGNATNKFGIRRNRWNRPSSLQYIADFEVKMINFTLTRQWATKRNKYFSRILK